MLQSDTYCMNIVCFPGDCFDGSLTNNGGAAHTDGGYSFGCYSGCPIRGSQVHVIAQNGGEDPHSIGEPHKVIHITIHKYSNLRVHTH